MARPPIEIRLREVERDIEQRQNECTEPLELKELANLRKRIEAMKRHLAAKKNIAA